MEHTENPLLVEIEAYLDATGVPESTFGRDAINDPAFVAGLRRGREPRRRTEDRARRHMAENPPAIPTPASFAGTNAGATPSTTPAGESV